MSKNDPFWDLKTDSGSSRRALAFSGLKTCLGATKRHFFENLHATLDLQVLFLLDRPNEPNKNQQTPTVPQATFKAETKKGIKKII